MPKYYIVSYIENYSTKQEIFNIVKTNNDVNIYQRLAIIYMAYRNKKYRAGGFAILFEFIDKAIEKVIEKIGKIEDKSTINPVFGNENDITCAYVQRMIQNGGNDYGMNGFISIVEYDMLHI